MASMAHCLAVAVKREAPAVLAYIFGVFHSNMAGIGWFLVVDLSFMSMPYVGAP